jgi:endonuclease/exonuclease/phosphatase family metal-dependent hydrolase
VLGTWSLWLLGRLLRDASIVTTLMSYIPSPATAAACLALAIGLLVRRRRARAAVLLGAALLPALSVLLVENRWLPPEPKPAGHGMRRLAHWNVMGGRMGWSRIADRLDDTGAQIIVLSEAPDSAVGDIVARMSPGAEAVASGSIVVAARSGLREERHAKRDRAEALLAVCRLPGSQVRVMAVDFPGNPLIERKPLVLWVFGLMEEWQPDIVVGDMNTPRDVSVLGNPPAGFVHAYGACGAGLSYTWPVPAPMWAIDQCLLAPRVQAVRYTLDSTLLSDHRAQVLDFRLLERTMLESGPVSD